jgi:hypothetical protein
MNESAISEFLGRFLVAGGGAALIAFGLFRWLGQKWIEDKFAKRLEQQRHDNAELLAELKVKWDAELQGKIKYLDREFQVIPEAWEKLSDAHSLFAWLTSRFQSYAAVGEMSNDELAQFFEKSELLGTQRQQMRELEGDARDKYYQHTIFFHRYAKVETAVREYTVFVNRNNLFMPDDLIVKLGKLADEMYRALTTARTGHEHGAGHMIGEAAEIADNVVQPMVNEVQRDVRQLMAVHRLQQKKAPCA